MKTFPIVLSAPSGTGKTTLTHLLVEGRSDLKLSVSFTTRSMRNNEQNGTDYNFIDEESFQKKIKDKDFLEWANVHGNFYGSSLEWTKEVLDDGKNVLFDIDVQGGMQIKQRMKEAVLIFIVPPDLEELKRRLTTRGTDEQNTIDNRLKDAHKEIEFGIDNYDYIIRNDKLDRALFDLNAIIRVRKIKNLNRNKIKNKLLNSD